MINKVLFGEKELELKASAATPLRFKQIFNFDLLKTLTKIDLTGNTDEQTEAGLRTAELITKLGFIMNKQAEKADFTTMTIEDYYEWLDEFEPNTIPYLDIMSVYSGNEKTEVDAKKEAAEQSEN